jgi:hypothetical protein
MALKPTTLQLQLSMEPCNQNLEVKSSRGMLVGKINSVVPSGGQRQATKAIRAYLMQKWMGSLPV